MSYEDGCEPRVHVNYNCTFSYNMKTLTTTHKNEGGVKRDGGYDSTNLESERILMGGLRG